MAAAKRLVLGIVLLLGPGLVRAAPVWTEIATPREAAGLPDLGRIVERASPAVVSLVVAEPRPTLDPGDPLHDFFDRFYGDEPAEGLGTGFVIRADGIILTNAHVVEGGGEVTAEFDLDGFHRSVPCKVLGVDRDTDIAVLKIEVEKPLPVLPLGDSDGIRVADWVVAIGNPFGLSHSVTFGIVSQTGRADISPQGRDGYFDFIQTDASINPGNSGGPLLNLDGEVVAINNAINASGQGIGFAVPINMAKHVIPQLVKDGKVTRAWVGMSIKDLDFEAARKLGMRHPAGVLVSEITPGSPAAKAGLKVGDVVVRFDGAPVGPAHRLRWDVACEPIGKNVSVEVLREGKPRRVTLTTDRQPSAASGMTMPTVHFLGAMGFAVDDTDGPAAAQNDLPAPTGARVAAIDPDGAAHRAGLRQGDIILRLDGSRVESAGDLGKRLAGLRPGDMIELRVRRGGEDLSIPLRVPADTGTRQQRAQ